MLLTRKMRNSRPRYYLQDLGISRNEHSEKKNTCPWLREEIDTRREYSDNERELHSVRSAQRLREHREYQCKNVRNGKQWDAAASNASSNIRRPPKSGSNFAHNTERADLLALRGYGGKNEGNGDGRIKGSKTCITNGSQPVRGRRYEGDKTTQISRQQVKVDIMVTLQVRKEGDLEGNWSKAEDQSRKWTETARGTRRRRCYVYGSQIYVRITGYSYA